MLLLTVILILIGQSTSDGFYSTDKKKLSKLIECIYIGLFLLLPTLVTGTDFHYIAGLILFYLFARLSIYDLVYNITAKLSLNYVGRTSFIYDDFMRRLKDWQFWIFRIFFAFLAIIIYVKVL